MAQKKLWGGRFGKETNVFVEEFTRSIHYDYKLARYDILGSILHVKILKTSGYLNSLEAEKLTAALKDLYRYVSGSAFNPGLKDEDIHTFIQNELEKRTGELALKLHTARSRNDQVVFATKVYCKIAVEAIQTRIFAFMGALDTAAKNNENIILPGFTHLQHAQPVYLKDYLGAYRNMFARDSERLAYISQTIKITMGAGALAGTPINSADYRVNAKDVLDGPEDIKKLIAALRVEPVTNSLDSVSNRDFVIELLSALSLIATHLSRLSEDLILWATREFGFIELDDAFCTGSSLMPQKKNPDVLELMRGYAGRIYGNLLSVLTMMKGLPLTYNRDMQLDKEPLFSSFQIIESELTVMEGLIRTIQFNREKISEHLKDESLYATDLVYYLVDKKIPFKMAHAIIGKLIKYSLDSRIQIKDLPEEKLKGFSGVFVKSEIKRLFDPFVSVKSKKSIKR
ncbi:MAG: argininosuccinate lyase [Candidatus Omnitrophica bacterium]|nr:argininosuccinate lyase [Candidatus Omnitrophota bacterium]